MTGGFTAPGVDDGMAMHAGPTTHETPSTSLVPPSLLPSLLSLDVAAAAPPLDVEANMAAALAALTQACPLGQCTGNCERCRSYRLWQRSQNSKHHAESRMRGLGAKHGSGNRRAVRARSTLPPAFRDCAAYKQHRAKNNANCAKARSRARARKLKTATPTQRAPSAAELATLLASAS